MASGCGKWGMLLRWERKRGNVLLRGKVPVMNWMVCLCRFRRYGVRLYMSSTLYVGLPLNVCKDPATELSNFVSRSCHHHNSHVGFLTGQLKASLKSLEFAVAPCKTNVSICIYKRIEGGRSLPKSSQMRERVDPCRSNLWPPLAWSCHTRRSHSS